MTVSKAYCKTWCTLALSIVVIRAESALAQMPFTEGASGPLPPPVVSPSAPGGPGPSPQIGADPLTGPPQTSGDVEWKATEKRTDGYNRHSILRGPWSARIGGDRNFYVDRLPSEYMEREQRWESRERMGGRVRTFRKEHWAFVKNPQHELNIRAYKADLEVNARVRSQLLKEQTDLEDNAGFERGTAPPRPLPTLREFFIQSGVVQSHASVGDTGIRVDYLWRQAAPTFPHMVLARVGPGVEQGDTSALLASFQSAVIKALPAAKAKAILADPSSALTVPKTRSGVIVAHHKMLGVVYRDFVAGKSTVGKADDLWSRWMVAARRDMQAMLQFAFLTTEQALDRRKPFTPDADRHIYGTTLDSSWNELNTRWFKGAGVVIIANNSQGKREITPLTAANVKVLGTRYAYALFGVHPPK